MAGPWEERLIGAGLCGSSQCGKRPVSTGLTNAFAVGRSHLNPRLTSLIILTSACGSWLLAAGALNRRREKTLHVSIVDRALDRTHDLAMIVDSESLDHFRQPSVGVETDR